MLLSSRSNPPRALSIHPNRHLSVKHLLLHSPLPSPALPSILPRHGKKPPKLRPRRIIRRLTWSTIVILIYKFLFTRNTVSSHLSDLTYKSSNGHSYEFVGNHQLPNFATPFAVNHKGKHRWTISIPADLDFPLSGSDYAELCTQAEDVAHHVKTPSSKAHHRSLPSRSYYESDPNFLDISAAQIAKILPKNENDAESTVDSLPLCDRTMTFALDETDSALGPMLMNLWLAYGLARREHRAFFIDDTRFAYGGYDDLFIPPLKPTCRRPPSTQIVPFPHQANHLVVGTSTSKWTFGQAFYNYFTLREIYDMARDGYEHLFHIRHDDTNYVRSRVRSLREDASHVTGVHIRRGDRHPWEFQHQHGYLPPSQYASAAREVKQSMFELDSAFTKIIIASDDPEIYSHPDIKAMNMNKTQTRISLASSKQLGAAGGGLGFDGGFFRAQFRNLGLTDSLSGDAKKYAKLGSPMPNLAKTKNPASSISGHDTNVGSEADIQDHSLISDVPLLSQQDVSKDSDLTKQTSPKTIGSKEQPIPQRDQFPSTKHTISPEFLQLRQLIARSYLLDLSILGKASDSIICGVSSYTCRVLAVMMGWEKAFESDLDGISDTPSHEKVSSVQTRKKKGVIDENHGDLKQTRPKTAGWINVDAPELYGWTAVDFW